MKVFRTEPILILGIVQAALALVVSFGLRLSADQTGAILSISASVASLLARTQVTPLPPPSH